jgi:hypothetical protein
MVVEARRRETGMAASLVRLEEEEGQGGLKRPNMLVGWLGRLGRN